MADLQRVTRCMAEIMASDDWLTFDDLARKTGNSSLTQLDQEAIIGGHLAQRYDATKVNNGKRGRPQWAFRKHDAVDNTDVA